MAKVKINFVVDVEVHKDGNYWIYFNKKYSIAGHGETRKKAKEMFFFCMNVILVFKNQQNKTKK